MERGDRFPAVLAWRDGKKLVMIDGNHRLTSAERAQKPLFAYEVKADPNTLVMMTFESRPWSSEVSFSRRGGLGDSPGGRA